MLGWTPPSSSTTTSAHTAAAAPRWPARPRNSSTPTAWSAASIEPKRFDAVNQTTAAQCYEFLIGTVPQSRRLAGLALQPRRPSLRFDQGPGVEVDAAGNERPIGDIIHTWVPSPSA
jgi:hypothetical protein